MLFMGETMRPILVYVYAYTYSHTQSCRGGKWSLQNSITLTQCKSGIVRLGVELEFQFPRLPRPSRLPLPVLAFPVFTGAPGHKETALSRPHLFPLLPSLPFGSRHHLTQGLSPIGCSELHFPEGFASQRPPIRALQTAPFLWRKWWCGLWSWRCSRPSRA